MINYTLPESVFINGSEYSIRSDYRAALDILAALSDPDLSDDERATVVLNIFYPDIDLIPGGDLEEAIRRCLWFLNGGREETKVKGPKLMDWEQDFDLYCPGVNHVLGEDIRKPDCNLHWWSFLSAYMEMDGEGTFGQVVSIRDKRARGKKLEKHEQEWLRRNIHLVEFKRKYTKEEDEFLRQWTHLGGE